MAKSRHNFDAEKLARIILAGVDAGLRAITVDLGKNVKEMLSRPGHGRVYVRSSAAKTKAGKPYQKLSAKAIKSARKAGVSLSFFRKSSGGAGAYITRSGLAQILLGRRAAGKSKGTIRSLGFHKASAPGEPPAVDTGNLRRSWQTGFRTTQEQTPTTQGTRRRLFVGSAVPYARLEFGMGKIAPRPYLRPSAAKSQTTAQNVMNNAVAKALRDAGVQR